MPIRRPLRALPLIMLLTVPLHAATPYQPTPSDTAALQAALILAKSDPKAAMTAVVALHNAHPNWPDPLTAQGLIHLSQNEPVLAKNAFHAAAEIAPDNRDALFGLASTSTLLHQPADALAALDRILASTPADGQVALLRAQALIANHQKPEAAKYLAALLATVKPADRLGAYTVLVPLQLQADDFASANTSATQWTVIAPDSPDAFAYRADAHRGLQQFEDAAADLHHAFALNHNQPTFPILFITAQLHLSQNNPAAAIAQLVDLLELAPANPDVEAAISVAVAARQTQLAAAPATPDNVPDNLLVPRVKFDDAVAPWELRNAIGKERIRTPLADLARAQSLGESLPAPAIAAARALYPAPEIYAAALLAHAQFSLDNPHDAFPSPTDNAQAAVIEARVAAALAAVHFARHLDHDAPTAPLARGYLAWADFQQHLLDHSLSPAEQSILAARALDQSHDTAAALDAYLAAESSFPASPATPATLLANRLLNSPALLHALIKEGVKQVDHLITEDEAAKAPALADRLIAVATRSSQNDLVPNSGLATAYIAKAHALRATEAKDKAEQAAKAVAAALKADPLSEDAHLLLARDLHDAGMNDQALLEANMAAAGEPEINIHNSDTLVSAFTLRTQLESESTTAKVQALYTTTCNAAYKGKNWPLAYACAARLQGKEFGQQSAGTSAIAGLAALNLSRHEDAAMNLAAAMATDPKLNLHAQLADAHAALHHLQPAIDEYTAALKLDPKNAYALRARATTCLALPNYPAAIADFQALIANDDPSTATQLALADALSHTDPPAAIKAYQKAIDALTPLELFADSVAQLLQAKARLHLLQHP